MSTISGLNPRYLIASETWCKTESKAAGCSDIQIQVDCSWGRNPR